MPHPDGEEQLAVIRGPKYGMDDHGPQLSFHVHLCCGGAATLSFRQPEADEIIRKAKCSDVKHLDGHTCYVYRENGLVRFSRMSGL